MKFLADMGVSPLTVKRLRDNGYKAIHLSEQGLMRMPDAEILSKATRESRIVLTFDLDFTDLLAQVSERNLNGSSARRLVINNWMSESD